MFITPAIAGPFDLGTVVVRAGLYIDPATAQVTAKADPLPRILHGIPLDVRSVTVNMSRPDFTLNPTSCDTDDGDRRRDLDLRATSHPLGARFQEGTASR